MAYGKIADKTTDIATANDILDLHAVLGKLREDPNAADKIEQIKRILDGQALQVVEEKAIDEEDTADYGLVAEPNLDQDDDDVEDRENIEIPNQKRVDTVAVQVNKASRVNAPTVKRSINKASLDDLVGGQRTPVRVVNSQKDVTSFFSPGGKTLTVKTEVVTSFKKDSEGQFVAVTPTNSSGL